MTARRMSFLGARRGAVILRDGRNRLSKSESGETCDGEIDETHLGSPYSAACGTAPASDFVRR